MGTGNPPPPVPATPEHAQGLSIAAAKSPERVNAEDEAGRIIAYALLAAEHEAGEHPQEAGEHPQDARPEEVDEYEDDNGAAAAEAAAAAAAAGLELCGAAARGDVVATHRLLHIAQPAADADARNAEQYTPMHLASAVGAVDVVRMLIRAGADASPRAPSGTTPLHTACRSNQLDVIEVLLDEGRALVHLPDDAGKTAVHVAAEFGHEEQLRRLLERGAALPRLDEHGRPALQLALDECGPASGVARRLAKQRWSSQLYKGQYRMDTRVERRGANADLRAESHAVQLDGAEVAQAQGEMHADRRTGRVELGRYHEWLDNRRTYPSLHARDRGSLQQKLRVGALDLDPAERHIEVRVCFGQDLASGKHIALLTFRSPADFNREVRIRTAVYQEAPAALGPGPPLRAYEDFRQPAPYCVVVPGWELTAETMLRRFGGRGIGRAQAVAVCFGVLQTLASVHAARIVHGRVSPKTVVRLTGGCWSVVEYHTALPFGADFAAESRREMDSIYCPPELHHEQGRNVTVVTPAWDIWGAGAVLILLLTGKDLASESSVQLLGHTDTPAQLAEHLSDLPDDPVLLDLVWQLVRHHPRQRMQAAEALRHPAFAAFGMPYSSGVEGGLGLGPSFAAPRVATVSHTVEQSREDSAKLTPRMLLEDSPMGAAGGGGISPGAGGHVDALKSPTGGESLASFVNAQGGRGIEGSAARTLYEDAIAGTEQAAAAALEDEMASSTSSSSVRLHFLVLASPCSSLDLCVVCTGT